MAATYAELVSRYTTLVVRSFAGALTPWMYRSLEGDLCIGMDHFLAGPGTPRASLERAIRSLWLYGTAPAEVDDCVTVGQLWGMQLNSRAAEVSLGYPVVDRLHPEMTADPARFLTRTDPDLLTLQPWERMADEAEELFAQPFGIGFDATYYQDLSTFRLAHSTILEIFREDVDAAIAELEGSVVIDGVAIKDFAAFPEYPIDAQMAVLDFARELGVEGLARYTSFRMAIGKRDWRYAAILCPFVSTPARNHFRRSSLQKAAEAVAAQSRTTNPNTGRA